MEWPHLMEQALRAHLVYERDKDYVVQDGEVIIVDEFTGRLLEGRQWSDGLHQAVEAKERVAVKEESQTLATITFQNYFRLYKKLAGMTGTAMTEAEEFLKIYKLDVVSVPTHRPVNRMDHNDRIYADGRRQVRRPGRGDQRRSPRAAGRCWWAPPASRSPSSSREMLTRRYGIEHQVLNARPENAAREAEIVAQAGQHRPLKTGSKQMVGNVTIATNMAGRGTDIKLGPGVVWDNCKVPPAEKLAELGVAAEDLFPARHAPSAASTARSTTRPRTAPTASSRRSTRTSPCAGGPTAARTCPAACTSSAPSATRPGGSTTSSAGGPAARATPAPAGSSCPCGTT